MLNEPLSFAYAYFIRQNFPKQWKELFFQPNTVDTLLTDSTDTLPDKLSDKVIDKLSDTLPEGFASWWNIKKNEVLDYWQKLLQLGIKVTYPGRPDYPNCFLQKLESPPLLLFYLGEPVWLNRDCLAVVGSRKITNQTKKWLEVELHAFLSETKAVVVSGGARGVDQEAHFQALRLSLPTIVALPSGLNKMYPDTLVDWKVDVLQKGGVFISEYFPDEAMKSYHFIQRNRLIATLGKSVLIMQGEKRSGTLLTAKLALELGQNLGVVPAHPMDSLYSGNHELLRWGINPVFDAKDLKVFCPMSYS